MMIKKIVKLTEKKYFCFPLCWQLTYKVLHINTCLDLMVSVVDDV